MKVQKRNRHIDGMMRNAEYLMIIGNVPQNVIEALKKRHEVNLTIHVDPKIDDVLEFVDNIYSDNNDYYIVVNVDEISPLLLAHLARLNGENYAHNDTYWRAFQLSLYQKDMGLIEP